MNVESATSNYFTTTGSYSDSTYNGVADSQFMQLLLAQLSNQNPLDPMNDQDFMGQLTQINMLNELKALNNSISEFSNSNQFVNATTMIGKQIDILTSDGTATVECTKVSQAGDYILVWYGDQNVPLSSVVGVSQEDES